MAFALPAGAAAFFLWKLSSSLFGDWPRAQRWAAIAAAFTIGVTSGLGFGVLGTTMNEWPGTALTIAALYLLVRPLARNAGGPVSRGALILAGLLSGFATGGKFTFGVFAVGMCAALLLRGPFRIELGRERTLEAFVFGLAVLAGTLASAGAWMWSLWTHFRNPIFPYANIWIKSPWWGQYEVMGRPFGSHTLAEWLVFPFSLSAPPPFFVTEMGYIDGRLPVVYGLALVVGAGMLLQCFRKHAPRDGIAAPVAPAWRVIAIFCVVSFVLWTAQYSILRYLVTLEVISGALIVALLGRVVRDSARVPVLVMTALALMGTTTVPDWWRIEFGRQWFSVDVPKLDRNPLVLLTTDAPMSYVLPFFPDDARFLGINNSISDARRKTLMEEAIVRRIREHDGPLYSLTYPAGAGWTRSSSGVY